MDHLIIIMVEYSIRAGVHAISLVMNKRDVTFIRTLIVDYKYKLFQGVKPRNVFICQTGIKFIDIILYLPLIVTETISIKTVIL